MMIAALNDGRPPTGADLVGFKRATHKLLRSILTQQYKWAATGKGLRQGMPLSPLLSNFVLRAFDRHFEARHAKLVRYADDFIIFARSEDDCLELLVDAKRILADKGHTVPDPGPNSKTVIARPDDPIEFLGYEIVPRSGTSSYLIQVPKRAFDKVAKAFELYMRLDDALKEFGTLDSLMRRNNLVAQSYANVYFLGSNRKDLRNHIEVCRSNAIKQIAIDLFGEDVLSSLSAEKRSFLGLQIKGLDEDF